MNFGRWVAFIKWVGPVVLLISLPGGSLFSAQDGQKNSSHIYTNEDPLFDHPPAEPAAAPDKPVEKSDKPVNPQEKPDERLAPFVATPMEVVDKMLELAKVTAGDVVYDLGSGDGRIVIEAAQKYSAKGVGVELDRLLVEDSQNKVHELNLEDRVKIIRGDLLKSDIASASVVTVYLMLGGNEKLRPKLEKELRPGTRVVTHDIRIPGWRPERDESVMLEGVQHTISLYQVPQAFREQ